MCSFTEQLISNNRKWAFEQSILPSKPLLTLSKQQTPNTLWIGCSDSRVPPELLTQKSIGDLFVHRNIANQFNENDLNSNSVLDYALNQLFIDNIVVCGHFGCGGVQSVIERSYAGITKQWLNELDDLYLKNRQTLYDFSSKEVWDHMCKLNTIKQAHNMLSSTHVKSAEQTNPNLKVHCMVYDLKSGRLHDLNLSSANLAEFSHKLASQGYNINQL